MPFCVLPLALGLVPSLRPLSPPPPHPRTPPPRLLFDPLRLTRPRIVLPPSSRPLTSVLDLSRRTRAARAVLPRPRTWRWAFHRLSERSKAGALSLDDWAAAIREAGGVRVPRAELQRVLRQSARDEATLGYGQFEEVLEHLLVVKRGDAVVRRNLATPERYTTRTLWLSTLRNFAESEVLVGIAQPLFWVTFCSCAVATLQVLTAGLPGGRQANRALVQMHSLLGGALSLLLVFRTNSAYNRFWEARRIWEAIVNRCRDLARFAHSYRQEIGQVRLIRLANLLCAYPNALRRHLVGSSRYHPALQPDPLPPLTPAMVRALRNSSNRPLFLCKQLAAELLAVPETDSFTSRERLMALGLVNQLSSYIGSCERLLQTPVPLNYARHTSRFLTLWCFTLPISLVGSMGFGVVPVTIFITWCLFGIQEIGLFIEHCALDNGDVFMDTIADQIMLDVVEAIQEEPPSESLWQSDSDSVPPLLFDLLAGDAALDGKDAVAVDKAPAQ